MFPQLLLLVVPWAHGLWQPHSNLCVCLQMASPYVIVCHFLSLAMILLAVFQFYPNLLYFGFFETKSHRIAPAGLKPLIHKPLTHSSLPSSASWMLSLQVCTRAPGFKWYRLDLYFGYICKDSISKMRPCWELWVGVSLGVTIWPTTVLMVSP